MRAFPEGFEKVKNFKEIFDKGKKLKTSTSQIILYLEKSEPKESKLSLGILALKKVVGKKAVHRNKAKRRYKNGMLECLKKVSLLAGFHIKVVALTNKNTITYEWTRILSDVEKELKFINQEIEDRKEKEDKKNAELL